MLSFLVEEFMNNQEFIIKKENIISLFFTGWIAYLSTFKLCIKHTIIPILGQLFGILLLSLVPILEYREMVNVSNTPDGWIYFLLSASGAIIFSFSLWKFFVVLCSINLLARDIYEDRAIANLSFYISDVNRKKWSYLRFLIGYLIIMLSFTAITALIMFAEIKLNIYNFFTAGINLILLILQSTVFLTYVLLSNIIIQHYAFNRFLGFWAILKRSFNFIKTNFIQLTILSFITILFSNLVAYLVQILISFLIINPFNISADNSIGVAIRFTIGFIVNSFIIILFQYIYTRFYLLSENQY